MRAEEPNGGVHDGLALELEFYQQILTANYHFTHNSLATFSILTQLIQFSHTNVESHLLIFFDNRIGIGW